MTEPVDYELQYRHNNSYDSVLLVDPEHNRVLSEWSVDRSVLADFCNCGQDAADWDDQRLDARPQHYGKLIAVRRGYTLTAVDLPRWTDAVALILH